MKYRLRLRRTGIYILESGETLKFWSFGVTPVKKNIQEVHSSQVDT